MTGAGSAAGWASFFWIAFERSDNPMALLEVDRTIVAVNEAFARLIGQPPSELEGRRVDLLVPPSGWRRMESDWAILRRVGRFMGERELVRTDGQHLIVHFAAHGEVVTGRKLILSVVLEKQIRPATARSAGRGEGRTLTPRELEIVTRVALGRNAPEIARDLHLATSTVKTHLRNAMGKLGVHSQAQLVAVAMATGLLDVDVLAEHLPT